MIAREISASDGLTLVSYLTLPSGSDPDGDGLPQRPAPMVMLVHGGPWSRDSFGFDPRHQWLANRGYAVLSVNFRGSTGFGKAFLNAGNLEWGRRMQQDLTDAVGWAVAEQIADPTRVAVMGGSYGGYAALAGLAFTPDLYACGVSLVGPSNLTSLLNAIPPYWAAVRAELYSRVGDPSTQEGRQLLQERSPLFFASAIQAPLLVGQGGRDPRVPRAESDQIVAALTARRSPVTYLLFPNEGHGLTRPQNRLAWHAATEGFLGQCLGGAVEAIGDDFQGAEVYGLRGAALVPGLQAAAPRPPPRAPAAP
jgi:dipeptidyl aminopeptidase/acylaminoacyl peptidase